MTCLAVLLLGMLQQHVHRQGILHIPCKPGQQHLKHPVALVLFRDPSVLFSSRISVLELVQFFQRIHCSILHTESVIDRGKTTADHLIRNDGR